MSAIMTPAMRYRRFGRTNLSMPVFSCGGMRYQHQWQDADPDTIPADNQANLEATIHRALQLGINHIETARGYGTSEMQLGRLLPTLPRERIIVQTKVAPMPQPAEFHRAFNKSMGYLRLDYVDLLSFHGINTVELLGLTLRRGGCLQAARQLQREGRVRFVGFSTHAPPALITRAIETGEFDYVNLHWYFVNPLTWPAVQAAAARDMGVFIISPNDKGGKLYDPPAKLRELCRPLTPMMFNDLYCLARPEVHTLSCGAARPCDFDEHVRALEFYDSAAQTVAPIEARLRAQMQRALGADWCARWHEQLPEYYDLPGQVNVVEILRLWTHAMSLGLVDWGKMRYNLLGGEGGHWFPGAMGDCFDEHQLRAALAGHPFADRIPAILREAHRLLHDKPKKRLSQETT
jgi:predicted aldo/keto reductase-like oxidoreductase